jgi:hypothetical protein
MDVNIQMMNSQVETLEVEEQLCFKEHWCLVKMSREVVNPNFVDRLYCSRATRKKPETYFNISLCTSKTIHKNLKFDYENMHEMGDLTGD